MVNEVKSAESGVGLAVYGDLGQDFHCHCCFFVFDWWGVSTAIQIRLYAGLLSVLPLKMCGMSLHVH